MQNHKVSEKDGRFPALTQGVGGFILEFIYVDVTVGFRILTKLKKKKKRVILHSVLVNGPMSDCFPHWSFHFMSEIVLKCLQAFWEKMLSYDVL